jgi:hypothetical protein
MMQCVHLLLVVSFVAGASSPKLPEFCAVLLEVVLQLLILRPEVTD